MITFPNAKINIGLFVTSKRADGYHNLETLFFPVKQLCDALEILIHNGEEDQFSTSGLTIDGHAQDNLCMKALQLMRSEHPIPPLKIHLHKKIPFGAGLGGGSADAAFMLKMLNQLFNINYSDSRLESMAALLGADCPVFIKNRPVLAKGIGNEFYPTDINLKSYWLQVVIPPVHVPTTTAYKHIIPKTPDKPLEELTKTSPQNWKNLMNNDFETNVFSNYPIVESAKNRFYENGAIYASMSGSGSSVYGLFVTEPQIAWPQDHTVHTEQIMD
ncbi:4-(cytidine 5'-diphospho)-2-C-methyl-D-erythritol kinase [Alkaliflexus imshenetskii]|uniref:4-(cytidine 5'-diphospho)-2-C-methyl-D-erythritol kinase n=1 Tax=Alkaliflexus imshenetskii TaxID=286730 RepID=UPI0004B2576B|nr:4-(cytidine 5'-diphospho)-2-C-methyl-D-erythritol kinase [Alkaliflexus imshenetskii]